MEEYEYSFKVKSIEPYIKYCIDNNYEEISVTKEHRVVYGNIYTDHLISRITTKKLYGKKEITIDFKNICSK